MITAEEVREAEASYKLNKVSLTQQRSPTLKKLLIAYIHQEWDGRTLTDIVINGIGLTDKNNNTFAAPSPSAAAFYGNLCVQTNTAKRHTRAPTKEVVTARVNHQIKKEGLYNLERCRAKYYNPQIMLHLETAELLMQEETMKMEIYNEMLHLQKQTNTKTSLKED